MKVVGIILILVGIGLTIFSGYNYIKENSVSSVADNVEITEQNIDRFAWSPFAGIACLSLGGVILLLRERKKD